MLGWDTGFAGTGKKRGKAKMGASTRAVVRSREFMHYYGAKVGRRNYSSFFEVERRSSGDARTDTGLCMGGGATVGGEGSGRRAGERPRNTMQYMEGNNNRGTRE